MTRTRLILLSLKHYWRSNLAVLLGVIVGTAVIGGALIVGDSVRASLRRMTLDRLGRVDHALHTHRFVREALADDIAARPEFQDRFEAIAPALLMTGSLDRDDGDSTLRASRLNVFGLDERLWSLLETNDAPVPTGRSVVLNHRTAVELNASVGDDVTLWIELPSTIPRDSLLGEREEVVREFVLNVSAVLAETTGAGRLDLNPSQHLPGNAFVSLDTLQEIVELSEGTPRNPRPARINTFFVQAGTAADTESEEAAAAARQLTEILDDELTLDDLSLRIDANDNPEYLSLESVQMFVEADFAAAAKSAAADLGASTSPVLVYLANWVADPESEYTGEPESVSTMREAGLRLVEMVHPVSWAAAGVNSVWPLLPWPQETWYRRYSMYLVIAGLNLSDEAPFGPFQDLKKREILELAPDDILINEWLAQDLGLAPDDHLLAAWHAVGAHGELPEEEQRSRFRVAGILSLENTPAADQGFTPEVEGFTDAATMEELDLPFLVRKKRITDRDEDYWELYRATPKAFVSLETAQRLWRSRYGQLTSLRVSTPPDRSPEESPEAFEAGFLAALTPDMTGLAFDAIKYRGLQAAVGANDFTGLFVGFSFFLILSAAILIGLLFRLGIERRARSIGLLSAVGLTPRAVQRMFLTEGLIVVVAGGVLGSLAAVGYAALMMHGLRTWWIGAIGTRFLTLHVTAGSIVAGFLIGALVTVGVVYWSLRQLRAVSTRSLLAGVAQAPMSQHELARRGRRRIRAGAAICAVAVAVVVCALVGLVPGTEAFGGFSWQVVAFFVVGLSILTGSLVMLGGWLSADRSSSLRGRGLNALGRLSARNAARSRSRTTGTVGLIAVATFVIVAVAAGRRNPATETPDRDSGNGGFTLVAESSQDILPDLNSESGRDQADFIADDESAAVLDDVQVYSFRLKPGEDASCLNLYQTRLPTVLGTPRGIVERGGFRFANTPGDNPWMLLDQEIEPVDGVPVVPVLGDMNTLQYSLKKGIGSDIVVPDEQNAEYRLRVAGMFDGSVFQGVLLMSDRNFRRLYPDVDGFRYFLIETPPESEAIDATSAALESGLTHFGFDAERVSDRIANFLAVQNTYLSTFQTLGSLGLLLGTFGLATVMLRNVLERRSEIALFRAVGFGRASVSWLVLSENMLLLLWGLVAGTVSALLAMTPHLMTTGADMPWSGLLLMLAGIGVAGLLSALIAVRQSAATPIVESLRAE